MSKTNAAAVKNAKKHKKIYLYPNAEDSQAAFYIIQELQNQNKISKQEIVFVDDKELQSSLEFLKQEIARSGELWIFHQEQKIYHKLCKNAACLPIISGIERLQKILCVTIEQIDQKEIEKNSMNDTFRLLNYASYFLLHFWISLDEQSAFVQTMKQLSQKINTYFVAHFNIEPHTIGIAYSHFSNGKHLGEIGEILKSMGQKINYVVNDKETLQNLPLHKQKDAICFPLQNSYMGVFFNLFRFYVTCQMPLTTPNWGQKLIYVSHAYIDPIAALIQRNRPLDDFWFSKKIGINGYRMLSSLSNYSIFKDKFEDLGYQDELVCAGYPSLDNYIAEYQPFLATASVGGGAY